MVNLYKFTQTHPANNFLYVSGMMQSPTAALFAKKCRTQLSKAQKREDLQSKKIAELTEERDSLLKQLSECKLFTITFTVTKFPVDKLWPTTKV
ncbi:MAG: hypothetical protein ACRC31_05680 [Cetobacterium sp.]